MKAAALERRTTTPSSAHATILQVGPSQRLAGVTKDFQSLSKSFNLSQSLSIKDFRSDSCVQPKHTRPPRRSARVEAARTSAVARRAAGARQQARTDQGFAFQAGAVRDQPAEGEEKTRQDNGVHALRVLCEFRRLLQGGTAPEGAGGKRDFAGGWALIPTGAQQPKSPFRLATHGRPLFPPCAVCPAGSLRSW